MVFIYNCRERVPVKIDSLAFLGEGKENWTIFSWPHCGIFKTSNEKAPHKLEVKIAKNPFISHTSLKGKEQLAFPPSCAVLVEEGDSKAGFQVGSLRCSLPVVAMWIPRSQPASGDESERPAVWMWVSTQSMTKWRNKAPLGKETSTQMEKRHNGLGGDARLQNIMSRVTVGILKLEKSEELQQYLPACSQD